MPLVRQLHAALRASRCLRPRATTRISARVFSQTFIRRAPGDDDDAAVDDNLLADPLEEEDDGEDEDGEGKEGEDGEEEDEEQDEAKVRTRRGPFRSPSGARIFNDVIYETWKTGEGVIFRTPPPDGRHYLGGDRPFPLNPSFNPPVPMSDARRTLLYADYMKGGTVRELSQKYGISLRRVEAVLRLKHLEMDWRKGRSLETNFKDGMELALGVTAAENARAGPQTTQFGEATAEQKAASDAELADFLHDLASHYTSSTNAVKMYWEPVEEGKEPFLDNMLSKHRQRQLAREAERLDKQYPVKTVPRRDGKKTQYQFSDVGDLYVDKRVLDVREKKAQRRRDMGEKKDTIRRDELRRASRLRSLSV